MVICYGKPVCEGIAIGKISIYSKKETPVEMHFTDHPELEIERYHSASEEAKKQLEELLKKASDEAGKSGAAIFEAHRMILDDPEYVQFIENMIVTQHVNAEYAVSLADKHFSNIFEKMDNAYFRERSADMHDICERIVAILSGESRSGIESDEKVIVFAKDLSPSETAGMNKNRILSFVTVNGSALSHTAILARNMNIPAVVGCNIPMEDELNGKTAAVDGYEGKIYIEPDDKTLGELRKIMEEGIENRAELNRFIGKENRTKDGKKIDIFANVGNLEDCDAAIREDAGGIGLFRTEFLFLGKKSEPTEEEQFEIYRDAALKMKGKEVIIRTIDIGADKQADYLHLPKEENPAMGLRAIRICLTNPEIFKTQLRAILRASAFGNISIMFPMIISVTEIKEIKETVEQIKKELDDRNINYDKNIKLGIMIETPAAVMIADELAKEVDFFSVGTNDLTQYTLAIDRGNGSLDSFYDVHHPAIFKMLQMTADAAKRQNIRAGICGEIAGDVSVTKDLLAMGYEELSVTPGKVLSLRKAVLETDVEEYKNSLR